MIDAAAGISASFEGRDREHGIVDGCSGAGGHLANRACSSATLSEKVASCVHVSSNEKTDKRSPGRKHLAD